MRRLDSTFGPMHAEECIAWSQSFAIMRPDLYPYLGDRRVLASWRFGRIGVAASRCAREPLRSGEVDDEQMRHAVTQATRSNRTSCASAHMRVQTSRTLHCSAYSTVDRLGKQATTLCAKGHKRSGRANPYVVGSLTAAARVSPESTAPRAVSAKHSRTAIGALWFALVEAAGVRSWGKRILEGVKARSVLVLVDSSTK